MKRARRLIGNGRRRWISLAIAVLVVALGGFVVYLDEQHSFDLSTETFTFESGGNELAATLHLPISAGPHGVVIFVSGDGTADADPGALPVWEALANAGYATVKWDKPGTGDSSGNWLDQDMADRATEVIDVLNALADRDDIDSDSVGVMGISQGGWVLPLVAKRVDVDFFIAWSTAINWEQQGKYLTERLLVNADTGPELAERVRTADQAARGDTYQDYLAWYEALDEDVAEFFQKMSEDRWRFAVRNKDLDAALTLPAMRNTPVLLLLGGRDDNVDVADTERVYREILGGPCLDIVRYPRGDHELLDHDGLSLTLTGILEPRAIFADGMLADMQRFAELARHC